MGLPYSMTRATCMGLHSPLKFLSHGGTPNTCCDETRWRPGWANHLAAQVDAAAAPRPSLLFCAHGHATPSPHPPSAPQYVSTLSSSQRARSAAAAHPRRVRRNGAVGRSGGRRARDAGGQEPAPRHATHRARGAAAGNPADLRRPGAMGPRRRRNPARPRHPAPMAGRR